MESSLVKVLCACDWENGAELEASECCCKPKRLGEVQEANGQSQKGSQTVVKFIVMPSQSELPLLLLPLPRHTRTDFGGC